MPAFPRWAQCNHKVAIRDRQEGQRPSSSRKRGWSVGLPQEAGKGEETPRASRRNTALSTHFGLLTSRIVRAFVLCHEVCGNLLQRPQETNAPAYEAPVSTQLPSPPSSSRRSQGGKREVLKHVKRKLRGKKMSTGNARPVLLREGRTVRL